MSHTSVYDEDDQDRTPSDFTVLELRTAALGRVAARAESLQAALNEVVMACAPLNWATDGTPDTTVRHVREVVRRWQAAEAHASDLEADREESSQFATERNAAMNELRREVEGLRARLAMAEGRPNL